MLPEDLKAVKTKILAHLKDNDAALLKKTRSDRYYDAETDAIIKLTGLGKSMKLRFPILVIDTETTGLHPDRDKPVQLGLSYIIPELARVPLTLKWTIASATIFDLLKKDFWAAKRIHNIPLREMLIAGRHVYKGEARYSETIRNVIDDLNFIHTLYPKAVLAGHNVGFDYRFLVRLYELVGERCPFDYHLIDLSTLAQIHLGVRSLDEIARTLGIDITKYQKHDAGGDAELTADCLIALLKRL